MIESSQYNPTESGDLVFPFHNVSGLSKYKFNKEKSEPLVVLRDPEFQSVLWVKL